MQLPEILATGFSELGLAEPILRAVEEAGYKQPTAIQAQAIPVVLAGRDVVGIAQTGTGKTASFVLPMLHVLSSGRARARMPRSLILSPTRELATQTSANFETYGKHLNLSMALLIGGVGMGDQEKALEKGVDVLIATPGRLLDWFERGRVLLGGVQMLVIDEADRMLDMGFIPDVERIVSLLTKRGQTLLFSATMLPAVRRLADRFLRDPAQIEVARPATMAEGVEGFLVPTAQPDKRNGLVRLIREQGITKAIVFCNRKRDVSALNKFLQQKGLNARDIHGDLEQVHRQATLDAFKADQVDFLVATDVAARGLDISDMPCVVNFDVPFNPEDYIHRIGRTGRAGKKGRAFTFAVHEEGKLVAAIERLTGKPIARLGAEPAAAMAVAAAEVAPLAEQPEAAGEAEAAPRPARGRRMRGRTARAAAVAEPAAEAEAATEAEVEVARDEPPVADRQPEPAEAAPAAARGRQPGQRGDGRRRGRGREAAAAAVPAAVAEVPPAPPQPETRPGGPVIAFGDHWPAFILRPVPLTAKPSKAELEAEAAEAEAGVEPEVEAEAA